jgi:pimeloyl-ACP methyl ester carboxylesterase
MRVLILPDLFTKEADWQPVIDAFTKAGVSAVCVPYTPPRSDDLTDLIEDTIAHMVDKTYILASGVGGRIAIAIAAQHPHHLAGMTLMATPAMPEPGFRHFMKRVLHFLSTPWRIIVPWRVRQRLDGLLKRLRHGTKEDALYSEIVSTSQEAFFQKITIPVVLLWGKRAKKITTGVAEEIIEQLEKADLRVVSDGADELHKSHPELVAQSVTATMQKLP